MANKLIIRNRKHLKELLLKLTLDPPREGEQTEHEIRYTFLLDICNADFSKIDQDVTADLICNKCKKPMERVTWCERCGLEVCSACMPPKPGEAESYPFMPYPPLH